MMRYAILSLFLSLVMCGCFNCPCSEKVSEKPITQPDSTLLNDVASVSASSFESKAHGGWADFPPELTLDGNLEGRSSWRAESKSPDSPQWIRYDLGSILTITRVRLAFVKGDSRSYFIRIDISSDGEGWQRIFDGQSSGKAAGFEDFLTEPVKARYLRVSGLGNTNEKFSKWINITEAEIWSY